MSGPEVVIRYPDGRRFLTFEELDAVRYFAEQRASSAEQRAARLAELMRRVLSQQAAPAEVQELQQLLDQQPPPSA